MILLNEFALSEPTLCQIDASDYNEWIYFSFLTESIVIIDNPENSLGWDIAFQRYHIKTNSGTSGSGSAGAYVDSLNIWTNTLFSSLNEVPLYAEFNVDTMLNSFYDSESHEMSWGSANFALETWGEIDTLNNYTMVISNNQLIIRAANGNNLIKIWLFDYYNENGISGHVSFLYDNEIECSAGIDDFGICGGNNFLYNHLNKHPKKNSITNIYPNPFNPIVNINYKIFKYSKVKIEIFNIKGNKIKELYNNNQNTGKYNIFWNADKNVSGNYYIKMSINNQTIENQKIILMK